MRRHYFKCIVSLLISFYFNQVLFNVNTLRLMTFRKSIILVLMLSLGTTFAQYTTFRLHPSDTNQIEPTIVVHPSNPQILFASAFTVIGATLREGVYVTLNGGQSWYGIDRILGDLPTRHGGDPGPLIDKNGTFILTHRGNESGGWWSNSSTDNGVNWAGSVPIFSSPEDVDKGSSNTDAQPSSSYYGRSYLVWTRFAYPFPILVSYSSSSGTNWSPYIQINNSLSSGHYSIGPSITIGTAGQVYVAWAATVINGVEDRVGFAVSTNGGLNWTVLESAYDVNGIKTSQLSPWTIRANGYPVIDVDRTGGSRHGWIYIVTGQKNLAPSGSDPDIIFHRSTNGGLNWSSGVRVNQDPLNNGKIQFFPAVDVDEDGGINVVYYDNRNSADSVDVFLSRSTNGGNTWTDYLISNHKFKPASVTGAGGNNMGDNISIASANGKLYPVWMDNKVNPGIFQVLTAIVDYTTIGVKKIGSSVPAEFTLKQNYPNPFNPSARIRFHVPSNTKGEKLKVELVVFDILGNNVRTLVNNILPAGIYEVTFSGANMPSGIYFYRLSSEGFLQTRKMVLVK
jgi:Secretion system C-terminal sorting domain